MINQYFILIIALVSSTLTAQTITFPDADFKVKLLQSDISNTIARNLSDDYFAIDVNKNGEIEITEALQVSILDLESSSISSLIGIENFTNLVSLQCSNNQISNLNISNLTILTDLICNSNIINTLTINGATNLQNLYCQSNKLTILNANDLTNLLTIDCSDNKLTSVNLNNLNNLQSLTCNSNTISSLYLDDLISLLTLECSRNTLTSLDLSKLTNITSLNCNFNQLPSLDVSILPNLVSLNCTNNQLASLTIDGLVNLSSLNCNHNQLTTLNTTSLAAITYLYCNTNNLQSLLVNGLMNLKVLDFTNNQITTLDINGLTNLQYLYCTNNKLVTLDASNQTGLQFLFVADNLLNSLFIKNGSNESSLLLSGNPNLNYICADESEMEHVQDEISNNGYTNCFVNSYCSFVPGGNYYTIEGKNKQDYNNNGCDALDDNFPNLKLTITDDATTVNLVPDLTGTYSHGVKEGTYIISPVLENPTYYTISPASSAVTFPDISSPFTASFCITPNGSHTDLEITFLPFDNARTNFDSTYKIIYKNKGTVTQSGIVNLTFDANALNLVTANPSVSSQSTSNLNWNFTNLLPQETRTILVTLKVKPSVNNGHLLNYNVAITNTTDETPNDNSADLSQIVVTSLNLNDKICLEGSVISPTKVGDYLHYMIRFENSGSATAQNIVLKDLIDTSKFDIATLVPLNGSHPFTTKITGNTTVEFIFQNINLPFDAGNNNGYVAFKIKTVPALVNGNEITNSATIYFDYNQPLATNIAITSIQALQIQNYVFSDFFTIYPNPVKNILNIADKKQLEVSSITIYNTLGQLVQTFINADNNTTAIDVSQLKTGIYFIKINSDKESTTSKFIKE
ncbi:T9SS type A sorting domain-containing protein [Flavobacterium sp. XS2P12]|uniref:T9SS type A sorting domain-containing protein n=1 Tax=Flavobacterium melibiosi TaxID=3398734 RepID=UPI003A86221F